ncbi:MAG TPA: hypothetical protein VFR80_12665 [Pyrinomonadaceae bacterium]|nr:hypothetical protein [Pyrinomonadaceae bacterium]
MDTKDNVLKFRPKHSTPEELEAWRKFVTWAATATRDDWQEKYGEQAAELYDNFFRLFFEFVTKSKTSSPPVE